MVEVDAELSGPKSAKFPKLRQFPDRTILSGTAELFPHKPEFGTDTSAQRQRNLTFTRLL